MQDPIKKVTMIQKELQKIQKADKMGAQEEVIKESFFFNFTEFYWISLIFVWKLTKDENVRHEWKLRNRYREYEEFEEEKYLDVIMKRDRISQGIQFEI